MSYGKLLALAAALVAVVAVAVSIWLNPPAENRVRAMDRERSMRLARLQSDIRNHFTSTKVLPATLDALSAGPFPPSDRDCRDPETGALFDYEVAGEKDFKLCAVFARDSDGYGFNRKHKAGRQCFEHTVGEWPKIR